MRLPCLEILLLKMLSLPVRATRHKVAWIFGKTAFFPKKIQNEIGETLINAGFCHSERSEESIFVPFCF
jgi:hypothetical protein